MQFKVPLALHLHLHSARRYTAANEKSGHPGLMQQQESTL